MPQLRKTDYIRWVQSVAGG